MYNIWPLYKQQAQTHARNIQYMTFIEHKYKHIHTIQKTRQVIISTSILCQCPKAHFFKQNYSKCLVWQERQHFPCCLLLLWQGKFEKYELFFLLQDTSEKIWTETKTFPEIERKIGKVKCLLIFSQSQWYLNVAFVFNTLFLTQLNVVVFVNV